MIVLGLTGSIGMGKTTVAGFFAEKSVPVYSADAAAHNLYKQPKIAAEIAEFFPQAVENGVVQRQKLAQVLFKGKTEQDRQCAVALLESVIHPHIREQERLFVQEARRKRHKLAVLDIPLLLETMASDAAQQKPETRKNASPRMDYIAVVSAPFVAQKERVLARAGMTAEKFAALSARQMPDAEKRALADFIIPTGIAIEKTRQIVYALIERLSGESAQTGGQSTRRKRSGNA